MLDESVVHSCSSNFFTTPFCDNESPEYGCRSRCELSRGIALHGIPYDIYQPKAYMISDMQVERQLLAKARTTKHSLKTKNEVLFL